MEDAVAEKMSTIELIRFFARMMFNQPPENKKDMFDRFLDHLLPPPPNGQDPAVSLAVRKKALLQKLEYIFRQFGTDCVYAKL